MNATAARTGSFTFRHHTAVLPPLRDGRDARRRVAICGGGPVGLALALGLARHGVPSVVFEGDDTVCTGSRAICVSRRSLEIVRRLGALPDFLAKGLPWTTGRSYFRDTEIFRFDMPSDPVGRLPPMLNLQQYYIEQFLLDAIACVEAETPGLIDVRWQSEVTALAASAQGVALQVATPAGDYRLDTDWLVACDGGQSFVRRALDLPMSGTASEGRYVIIDIELPSTAPTERRAWFDPPWNPGTTILMHRQPDDIWRLDYQLRHGEDTTTALQPSAVAAFVARHLAAIGEGHLPWRVVWTSVYRAGALTLAAYRHGRVLFAGNAAHVLPIFGVRGLNSGFEDADNLAWKLAWVVHGKGSDALLDSYSDERVQAFHDNAASALRSTAFMSPPSRGFDLLREAVLSLAATEPAIATRANPRQSTAISYRDSPLSTAGDALPAGPAPGEVLGDAVCARGGFLRDRLGRGFSVLVFGPAGAGLAFPPGVTVVPLTADGAAAADCGATDGAVYLVRPDEHVAARWHRTDSNALGEAWRRAQCLAAPR